MDNFYFDFYLYGIGDNMILGIVGSRRRNSQADKEILKDRILDLRPTTIVSGGCPKGADKFAEEIAAELGIEILIFRPKGITKRTPYFKIVRAMYERNSMIAHVSDHLIALVAKDRKGGTENTIGYFLGCNKKGNLEVL